MKDKKTADGAALLLTDLFTRAAKQEEAKAEREREEFRRRLGIEETD